MAKTLKIQPPKANPNLLFVRLGEGITSAVIVKESPQSWLVRPRFQDEHGDIYLGCPERFWKAHLGLWVWRTAAQAKADNAKRLRVKIADLQEALAQAEEYCPVAIGS